MNHSYPEMPESKVIEVAKRYALFEVFGDDKDVEFPNCVNDFTEGAKWAFKYMQEMEKMAGEVLDDRN